jgi:DNA-binding transcriptional MerR regulator
MVAITFDTLKFAKTLKEAGVPEAQAEAFSSAVRDSHEAAELATKADLREYESAIRADLEKFDVKLDKLETNLRHEINEVRHEIADLRKDMYALGQSMIIKLGSIVIVAVGALAAILKLL